MKTCLRMFSAMTLVVLAAVPASAQQTSGVPGSPAATTTLDGRYIPSPEAPFGGVINLDATNSTPYWPPTVVPPKGAPNVLLIITDDVGFGAPSTFGGLIPTPTLDRIANAGLRFTQFHSTALCSPSRAALITGRNHHSVGRHHGNFDGLSGVQQRHHQGQGDRRHDPQGQWLRDLVVW
jgi:Sulfatase